VRVGQAAIVLGAAVAVGGCGSSAPSATSTKPPNLPNIANVQSGIAQTILKYDHVNAQVYCPRLVPQISGQTFSCVGISTQPKVQTFVFQATVHSGTLVSWARTG
jgi:hypothetical protein